MKDSGPVSWAVDVALVHYPVVNKGGETIGAALTNLDLHDIARACRTFGVGSFVVVTPFGDQQEMIQEILDHWLAGHGSRANPDRGEALSLVKVCTDLAGLYETITVARGERPVVLATTAKKVAGGWTYGETRAALEAGRPVLVLFGTAWGLAEEVFDSVDGVLPPIAGQQNGYNHLSVRSAVSIILDRLLGQKTE